MTPHRFAPDRSEYRKRYVQLLILTIILLSSLALAACSRASGGEKFPPALPAAVSIKIYTQQAGYYRVTGRELATFGFQSQPDQLAGCKLLTLDGETPFWFENGDLYFYAQSSTSRYSREKIYWLTNQARPAGWPEPVNSERTTAWPPAMQNGTYTNQLLEENLVYQPLVQDGDTWLWTNLPAPQQKNFEVKLTNLAAGQATLRVGLWSNTQSPAEIDHRMRVLVNGSLAAEESWDARGHRVISTTVSSKLLTEGTNTLTLDAPGVEGVAADVSFLDWIEITYPQKLQAVGGWLEFTSDGSLAVLEGFRGPVHVVDITVPGRAELVEKDADAAKGFQGTAGHRYLAAADEGSLAPGRIEPAVLQPDLLAEGEEAIYAAVGPEKLLEALQPLLELRASQGITSTAVPVQAVYDQFNAGMPEPEAVQRWMTWASENWISGPRYLLLVGDGSYDPRGYTAPPEANQLPTFLVYTDFGGETASDIQFAQVNEDPWPDLAVGRLPARTPEQVKAVVEKVIAFEQAGPASDQILAVADGQDDIFSLDANTFLDLFPEKFDKTLIAPKAGESGANAAVLHALQTSDWLVAYFGHGSINMWGKDKLFTNEEVRRWQKTGRLPIVLNLTCLTGLFSHPKVESLAEAMLWQTGGGAAAVLAPTSLTLPYDQSQLSKPFVEALLKEPALRLGDVLLEARRAIPADQPGGWDVMETFLLFGDPAMKLMP